MKENKRVGQQVKGMLYCKGLWFGFAKGRADVFVEFGSGLLIWRIRRSNTLSSEQSDSDFEVDSDFGVLGER